MNTDDLLCLDGSGVRLDFDDMCSLPDSKVPRDRISDLEALSVSNQPLHIVIDACCLLASWGYSEYVGKLREFAVSHVSEGVGEITPHRNRGYDVTCERILSAFISYWIRYEMRSPQEGEDARKLIFSSVTELVRLASKEQFELCELYQHVLDYKWVEYIPVLKEHFKAILNNACQHDWKVVDAINFLDKYDADFVSEVLSKHNKSRSDYPLDR
ncbi:hypothetical protein MIB92_10155 [Aestuariirhabdus sp. Z084]|uniref:hypothetical protein n=1 Tax=Aestuariirhabdus haliotis TaxID=2918751 RepID=UPI00201B3B73|nr:hypothetical protein [Aestuariirhabdus haliotis]MCL6416016.1 hypothetical protein [Aestuariirhabdus haliotis]MCL6419951.1 hypothetical protein [Aestuariirhabdus haliotis]